MHGGDFLRRDPDGSVVRLDVESVARDDDSGALLRFTYAGVVGMGGEEGKVIRGDGNATTTGFGNACEFFAFFCCVECLSVIRCVIASSWTYPMAGYVFGLHMTIKFNRQLT